MFTKNTHVFIKHKNYVYTHTSVTELYLHLYTCMRPVSAAGCMKPAVDVALSSPVTDTNPYCWCAVKVTSPNFTKYVHALYTGQANSQGAHNMIPGPVPPQLQASGCYILLPNTTVCRCVLVNLNTPTLTFDIHMYYFMHFCLMLQGARARDREVRDHEQAHARVGGPYAGQPSYTYQTGPDGNRYAIGGEVAIDIAPVNGDPEATIIKMEVVKAAALAPAEPSAQDRKVAALADAQRAQAVADLAELRRAVNETPVQSEYDLVA